jgi:hypothetical protein
MDLREEIKGRSKNLPKQVGDTLRKRLEQADSFEKRIALKAGLEQSKALAEVLRGQISQLEKL